MIEEMINAEPKAQPRPKARAIKKGGKWIGSVYTPNTAKAWKEAVVLQMKKHAGTYAKGEPVKLHLIFYFRRPQSHFTSNGALTKNARETQIFHTQKPDFDNLEKAVADAINNAKVWHDDSQATVSLTEKVWSSDSEGCLIRIEKLK